MTRRRRVGLALIAFGTGALALVLSASGAEAEAPQQTGWWFELQTSSLPAPLPGPPTVPDGGMFVQQGPNGPTAYGALRYQATNATHASLILTTAQGSTTSLGAPVQACPTNGSWQAPQPSPGKWDDAPTYDTTCAPGRISADGKAVAFDFGSDFIRQGALDVAIVPQPGAKPFALTFDKPGADSLKTELAPTTTLPTTPTVASVPSAPETAKQPAVAAPVAPVAPTPTTAPAAAAPAENRSAIANAALNIAGLGDPDRGERALALSGASAIVVGWWLLSTRSVRMPRLIGAMSGEAAPDAASEAKRRVGGVGRFSRTREHNPASLR